MDLKLDWLLLNKYVEDVLVSGLNEKIFNQEKVEELVREHMRGKTNHDILICHILNIQLLSKYLSLWVVFFIKGEIPQ